MKRLIMSFFYSRYAQILGASSPGDYILYRGAKYLWRLSTELVTSHPSGDHNIGVDLPFFWEGGNMCASAEQAPVSSPS
jgi:hypothetical protein